MIELGDAITGLALPVVTLVALVFAVGWLGEQLVHRLRR